MNSVLIDVDQRTSPVQCVVCLETTGHQKQKRRCHNSGKIRVAESLGHTTPM